MVAVTVRLELTCNDPVEPNNRAERPVPRLYRTNRLRNKEEEDAFCTLGVEDEEAWKAHESPPADR
jgi:hypothetical protein